MTYKRMPEPQRSQLLGLAANSQILLPEWQQCAEFPLSTSNSPDGMCRGWYIKACVWASQDSRLARLMLEDVASYISTTNASQGAPASSLFLSGFYLYRNTSGKWTVMQSCQHREALQAYMQSKGYIPTTAPSQGQPGSQTK
jgi:hypothetical protein